jgi:gamma-glutamyltranspeptidase/glutathione hydrolase
MMANQMDSQTVEGRMKGVIACGDPQTAAAGAAMLEIGGNAVDAAVAASFASFVAEAALVNIGGGGMAMIVGGDGAGEASVYDFFSTMPSGHLDEDADFREILVDFGPEQQPFYIGRASSAVPGVVAGLCAMAQAHGSLPLAQLLEPATRLARQGAILSEALAYVLDILTPIFTDTPGLAATFAPCGQVFRAGERMAFPALAETLERLGREGPDLFYTGAVGQAIVEDQRAHGGLITADDMAAYRVRRVRPIRLDYRGYTVLLPPPASSGGALIGFALKLLETVDVASLAYGSYQHVRLLAEVMRLTNLARPGWETSRGPDATRIEDFLSAQHVSRYQHELLALLNGKPAGPDPELRGGPGATTHISVVDSQGTIVGVTTSAGENAGYVVGETGVCMNNMLGEIDLHPRGFHRLPPEARLTTMMSPVVVLCNGEPMLAVGSGGSNRLRSAIMQIISNVIDFGMPLAEAIDAPRVHFEGDLLQIEGGIPDSVVRDLEGAGYRINHWPGRNMFFGGAHAVARQDGRLIAAGDQRRGGSMAVVP